MQQISVPLLLAIVCLTINGVACCYCDDFWYLDFRSATTINISLVGSTSVYMEARHIIDYYDCSDTEAHWEIERADGELEVYTVLNDTYIYGRQEELPGTGLFFNGFCHPFIYSCHLNMEISPTDLRYNGAQITGVFNLPECFNSPNVTDTITLNIQGLLEAPTDVSVDEVNVESVNVSWSPPFTLDGVPILHYSVYTTSQGLTEQRNTTETHIILGRPCASTTYQISAWNEVGEGNATTFDLTIYQAAVTSVNEQTQRKLLCVSCIFYADSTAEGCAVKLQNDEHSFAFNISRSDTEELVSLECSSVQEIGIFSVHVYEIKHGEVQEHISRELDNIFIKETEYSTLVHASVKAVNELRPHGICASCTFTSDSTAVSCAIELKNDDNTFLFNISHTTSQQPTVLGCFSVPAIGVYSVVVYEVLLNGTEAQVLRLPNVQIINAENVAEKVENDMGPVTGLSVVLATVVVGVLVAVLVIIIIIMRRRSVMRNKTPSTTESSHESTRPTQQATRTAPHYENQPATAAGDDNMYEEVELKATAAKYEEIDLSPNAAYGKVQR